MNDVDGSARPAEQARPLEPARSPESAGPPERTGAMTMTEYDEAMTERNQHARARGLTAPYIPGGRDPDPLEGRLQERHYLRLLVAMVVTIVLGGFVISIVGLIVAGSGAGQ